MVQVGIKNNDESIIKIDTSLAISKLQFDISSADSAIASIKIVDSVISELISSQTKFGTNINRLESIIDSIDTKKENLSASFSTIMDTDIAKESVLLTKNQILQQTASSLFMQSNNIQSLLVLSLLNPK